MSASLAISSPDAAAIIHNLLQVGTPLFGPITPLRAVDRSVSAAISHTQQSILRSWYYYCIHQIDVLAAELEARCLTQEEQPLFNEDDNPHGAGEHPGLWAAT